MRRQWLIPAVLSLALLMAVGVWGANQSRAKTQLQTLLANRYQASFYELSDHVERLEVLLAKGLVTSTPQQNMLVFTSVQQEADAAKSALSNIPISNPSLTRTNKFLTQVGDFAHTLNRNGTNGKPPRNSDWDKMTALHKQAGFLSKELNRVETTVIDDTFQWLEFRRETDRSLQKSANPVGVKGLINLDQQMDQYPALVYDGPFSEHLADRKPLGLTGDNVSIDLAKAKCQAFTDGLGGKHWRANATGKAGGTIPSYSFELKPLGGNEPGRLVADVSTKGGHLLWFLNSRSVPRSLINRTDAEAYAVKYMANKGMTDMEATYSVEQQNIVTISFAAKEKDVLVYPDLVNVRVAMDNGEILGWEAFNYYMSHRPRNIPDPKISQQEARQVLNPRLVVQSGRMAIIPDNMRTEKLCWEFNCLLGQDQFLIYINALTGAEEKIMKIVPTQNGRLAM